ncbi:MAG: hypothetical protein OJF49_001759 [Ktedonobacterales bacterium]|nr:MAG: hypothetical protein OJF49_001759 [Ktedonobacterales bacterium]
MKVKEAIEYIERDGWFIVRQEGSHHQYHHLAKPGTVTIAGKPSADLDPGTAHNIFKQAHIPWPKGRK